ncbi:MAG: preprotein translocase subunit YajC [Candidatus Poribacteria bacterium]
MDFITGIIPLILIIGVFYFLMVMPQQKKIKKHQNMLKNLTKGDEVVTEGGIYGTIVGLKDNIVVLKVATVKDEDVKIEVSRARIAFVVKSGELIEGTD